MFLYILSCFCVYFLYIFTDYILTYYSTSYKKLQKCKQTYVVANIVKSMVLLCLSPFSLRFIYTFISSIIYNSTFITSEDYKICFLVTSIYCSTDMISLLVQKDMKTSTILHHLMVQKALVTIFVLGEYHHITNILLVYGAFSILSYLVNFHLALRYLTNNTYVFARLATITYTIYSFSCGINWLIQFGYLLYFIYMKNIFNILFTVAFYCVVINDDIILLQYLETQSIKVGGRQMSV